MQGTSIPISNKIQLVKAIVWPVVTYGCESWTFRKNEEKRLEAFEMKENKKQQLSGVLNTAETTPELLDFVKASKLAYTMATLSGKNTGIAWTKRLCKEQCQVDAGEEDQSSRIRILRFLDFKKT